MLTLGRLSRRPVFSLLNVTLLTLTAAAVVTIFAIVNATLLRPLPYRDPDGLFQINTYEAGSDGKPTQFVAGPTHSVAGAMRPARSRRSKGIHRGARSDRRRRTAGASSLHRGRCVGGPSQSRSFDWCSAS